MPSARARLGLVTTALLLLPVSAGMLATANAAAPEGATGAAPVAVCGEGSRPETDLQGRIPPADVASGRAAQGYTCNTEQIGLLPTSAGWRVHRYEDCAYYNGEPGGAPLGIATQPTEAGTRVLDVSDPRSRSRRPSCAPPRWPRRTSRWTFTSSGASSSLQSAT